MNSYGTKKDELIDEIFRSSSTLTGVEDKNRLLMDCILRKDSGNLEENQKIQEMMSPTLPVQFGSISEILSKISGEEEEQQQQDQLSKQVKQSQVKQDQDYNVKDPQQKNLFAEEINELGPCMYDNEYFFNNLNKMQQPLSPRTAEQSLQFQRGSFCKSPTSSDWRSNVSSHYMLERLPSQQITYTNRSDQEEQRYFTKDTKQTDFCVDDLDQNQDFKTRDKDEESQFTNELNTIQNHINKHENKKNSNVMNKGVFEERRTQKQRSRWQQQKKIQKSQQLEQQSNELDPELIVLGIDSPIGLKWEPQQSQMPGQNVINNNIKKNEDIIVKEPAVQKENQKDNNVNHSDAQNIGMMQQPYENNLNGLQSLGDDLERANQKSIQSGFRNNTFFDPSNIRDYSEDLDRDNVRGKEDQNNISAMIREFNSEKQGKSQARSMKSAEKQIKSPDLSLQGEDSVELERRADKLAEFSGRETTRQLTL